MVGIVPADREIGGRRAILVLLVPLARNPQRRHRLLLPRQDLVERLRMPEGVVGRMVVHPVDVGQLAEPAALDEPRGRAGAQEGVVVVIGVAPQVAGVALRRVLLVVIVVADEPERPAVEVVVVHPGVDDRVLGHRRLQRRMRVDQRHRRHHAVVAGAGDADAAVGARDVLHQPIDRVVGVGRMVDAAGVERPGQRPLVHIGAARAVLAAHVLIGEDVAGAQQHRVGGADQHRPVRAGRLAGRLVGIVGRPVEEDRRVLGAPRRQDDGVQLDAVAHGNVDLAAEIVERIADLDEGLRNVARQLLRGGHAGQRESQDRRQPLHLLLRLGQFPADGTRRTRRQASSCGGQRVPCTPAPGT